MAGIPLSNSQLHDTTVFAVTVSLLPTLSGSCGDSEFEINSITTQSKVFLFRKC